MQETVLYGRRAEPSRVRLMVVDDSIVARSVLQAILYPFPEFTVAATASSAAQAMTVLDQTDVDIIILDLAMPGMDGQSALPDIVRNSRGARVLVVSGLLGEGEEVRARVLALGAADTLAKPRAGGFDERFRMQFVAKLRQLAMAGQPRGAPGAGTLDAEPPIMCRAPVAGAIACLAIGASTGGLHALAEFFKALPAACAAPILITQHLPHTFMRYFADQVADLACRPTGVAEDGEPLKPGRILVAPGDAHLGLSATTVGVCVALDGTRTESGCLPSVDPMLAGVASCFGARGFGVILSGMGRDGTIGARRLAECGGEIVVQDRQSSVVWGMPGSVALAGLASTVAPPARLAERIGERLAGRTHLRSART